MTRTPFYSTLALVFTLVSTAYRPVASNRPAVASNKPPALAPGVHFKTDGKSFDIPQVRGLYIKDNGGMFSVYNAGMPGFPETTITLVIGSDFTGSPGTFKGDTGDKGFVFGYTQGTMKDMIGYAGGKDDPSGGFTVASTPISITVTSFSVTGTNYIQGNVTAQGTFSGKVYDFKNKKTVELTDGTFNVAGSH
jgi:hypothetical protein